MVIATIKREWRYLVYLYRGSGVIEIIRHIARKLITLIYERQVEHITVRRVHGQDPVEPGRIEGNNSTTDGLSVERLESLHYMWSEISHLGSSDNLTNRLQRGAIVFLAIRKTGSGRQLVGYGIFQRGIFWVHGRAAEVSSDVLFSRYIEVLAEYPGQRVFQLIRETSIEYCKNHGLKRLYSVVPTNNRPSIQALTWNGDEVVGIVERISILRGLYRWETPWERIEAALRDVD